MSDPNWIEIAPAGISGDLQAFQEWCEQNKLHYTVSFDSARVEWDLHTWTQGTEKRYGVRVAMIQLAHLPSAFQAIMTSFKIRWKNASARNKSNKDPYGYQEP